MLTLLQLRWRRHSDDAQLISCIMSLYLRDWKYRTVWMLMLSSHLLPTFVVERSVQSSKTSSSTSTMLFGYRKAQSSSIYFVVGLRQLVKRHQLQKESSFGCVYWSTVAFMILAYLADSLHLAADTNVHRRLRAVDALMLLFSLNSPFITWWSFISGGRSLSLELSTIVCQTFTVDLHLLPLT